MPDDKPLVDVIADEVTDAIFQTRTAMVARSEVMTMKHVREVVHGVLVKRMPLGAGGACSCEADAPLEPAERVYAAYPRKVGRKTAIKAIELALKVLSVAELLAKVEAYRLATDKWPPSERQFIPYPATWFNRGSYTDDPKEWERGASRPASEDGRDYSKI